MTKDSLSQPTKNTKTKPVLFSLLILLSGIIIGSGATVIVLRPSLEKEHARLPEEFSRKMVKRLTHELRLTPQQQQQVRPIIENHMNAIDQYRQEARPKIRQELEEMNDELIIIFDNTQQQIWKEQIQKMQKRFPQMRGRGDSRGSYPEHQGQQLRQFRQQQLDRIPPQSNESQLPTQEEVLPSDEPKTQPPQEPNQTL